LHQQGRVLLDGDWNAQTSITTHWQDQAGRDVIGTAVAAVPAGEPGSFGVRSAASDRISDLVELTTTPGRVWADGILAYLPGEQPDPAAEVVRMATYLEPPVQSPPGDVSTIAEGVRDAVVLEVWREALNGFQEPNVLLEPALGGPDTTERVLTAMRFRLFRLAPEDTCRSIAASLQDDPGAKGKLRVSLQEPTTVGGDCPVEEGGGYVGFEHFLYRVEVAQVDDPRPMFKWSQFNGGLVGRGDCDLAGTDKKISITANDQAIRMSGPSTFYLEVVELDTDQGFRRVTYGAEVTLNGDDLEVAQERYKESNLPSGNVFFRLWNEIRPIADFPKAAGTAEPTELRDGIRLEFDPAGAANYRPGDYWTFEVRAGGISNPDTLIDDEPPQGIDYHRVPLAILYWDDAGDIRFDDEEIEDCRDVFQPLTNQTGCCSFTVGDGVSSRGDFGSIEQALRHLPVTGGELCLLPGLHQANVIIEDRVDIKIKGCDKRTRVIPGKDRRGDPIFHVIDSRGITLEHLDLITYEGTAVVIEGTEPGVVQDVAIRNNRILAYENAVRAIRASNVDISHNKLNVLDKEGAGVAVYVMAEDCVIERNTVSVVPAEASPTPPNDLVVVNGEPLDPLDPCADVEAVYRHRAYLVGYVESLWAAVEVLTLQVFQNPFEALGGIQILGGSERVRVLENRVWGGAGNGVTLGSGVDTRPPDPDEGEFTIEHRQDLIRGWAEVEVGAVKGVVIHFEAPDGATLSTTTGDQGDFDLKAEPGKYRVSVGPGYKIENIEVIDDAEFGRLFRIELVEEEVDPPDELAFLYEILIDGNEISGMGLSGIGIPRTAELDETRSAGFAELFDRVGNPVVNLAIRGNHVFGCLQTPFDSGMRSDTQRRGFGGVALGMCGSLSVHENRIENNGTTHVEPSCGLYLAYGERVEITHNRILENGPMATEQADRTRSGVRGGIVLGLASSLPFLDNLARSTSELARTTFAARIHDNVVEQPAGHALSVTAVGPVSVLSNYFRSDLSEREGPNLWAGAVLIQDIWGIGSMQSRVSRAAAFVRGPVVRPPTFNGNILFNDNQTFVGPNSGSYTSQLLLSRGDIGFDGNQSDNLKGASLLSNTLLLGATLRASDNRLTEVEGGDQLQVLTTSLLTISGSLNNTTNNQGNHCIVALNEDSQRPAVAVGNQVLPAGAESCELLERYILENADALIREILTGLGILKGIG